MLEKGIPINENIPTLSLRGIWDLRGMKGMGTEDEQEYELFLEGLGLSGSSGVGAVILTAEEEGREKKDISP